ncbi:MAG: DUF1844 domain-containing protein [Thermoguttaceae bacterium]
MSEQAENAEKKIIVDEDWKSQVAAEKEALRQEQQQQPPQAPSPQPAAAEADASQEDNVPLPPPSLTLLANSLYLQAAISLGLLPNPLSGKTEVNLPQAKHAVDTLEVLQEKTTGNRTPQESADIEDMLHHLRLVYVSVQEHEPGVRS